MPAAETESAATTIAEINMGNILAKARAGRVLSRAEEKRVAEYETTVAAQHSRRDRPARAPSTTAPSALKVADSDSASAPDTEIFTAAGSTAGTADSMKAAAAMSGFTEDQLGRAKAAGCPAFRGSRVQLAELAEWMAEYGDTLPTGNTALDAINLEIAREKLRKVRFSNDVEERRYILREDNAALILKIGLELKNILRKKLEEEFPERQIQRTREEILAINRALVTELCQAFQEGASRW